VEPAYSWALPVVEKAMIATVSVCTLLVQPICRTIALGHVTRIRHSEPSFGEVSYEFLEWLDDHKISLDNLRQDDLDRWLSEANTQRRQLARYFLKWSHQRGLSRKLVVPTIPRQQPAELLHDDDRWQLLQRYLSDETLPVDVRAAGALTLLFGLPAERIRNLTADQLTSQDRHTYLTAGLRPILLPPRLAVLLKRLATEPSRSAGSNYLPATARPAGCSQASCPSNRSPIMP
jgi:hypothetical protein